MARLGRGFARRRLVAVTWNVLGRVRSNPKSQAAVMWLATAGAEASTAAMQRPSQVSHACPTAYTPRWIRCRRPDATARDAECREYPSERNCRIETTPCC